MTLFERLRHFWYKQQLTPTARAVLKENLTYLSTVKFDRIERALRDVLARKVPGDVLEFGVALGGSAIVLAQTATRSRRDFHGFDVFGMIPEPSSDKDDDAAKARFDVIKSGKSKGINGELYYGYRDNLFDEVVGSFARHGLAVDGKAIALHKGLFNETWDLRPEGPIAFAHIDCDWYDPVKFCLTSVYRQLSPGGVIVLDDYHDYASCKRATDEFLAEHADLQFEDGRNAILRRTMPS